MMMSVNPRSISSIKKPYQSTIFYLLIILAAFQLFISLLSTGFALQQDEAMWHYIGRNWFRNGLVPYRGGVDNKSPLFFALFGLSDRLFGVNYWFPRVLGTLWQSIGIYFLYKTADLLAGRRAGLLAVSFYGLSVLWHGADGRYVSYTETYEITLMIISFYLFLSAQTKAPVFLSGIAAVIGLAFRLSAFFGIITLLLMALRKGRSSALVFTAGLLVGSLLLATACILAGIDLRDVYFYAFADNFGAGSISDHNFLWRTNQFYDLFFYSEIILYYPLVLVYVFIKRRFDWLLLWLTAAFIGINIVGDYARVEMKELLPAMALIAALSLAPYIELWTISFKKVLFVIWICFSPRLIEPFINFKHLFTGEFQKAEHFCQEPFIEPDENASRQLGLWVKANTSPEDKVYVAGFGSQVQAYSERLSPSIYFNVTQTKIAKRQFFKDLETAHPKLILVPLFPQYKQYVDADLRIFIDSLTAKNYQLDRCMFNYNVYKRSQ
jgi:Dolichyl-phosphate-mannose-protein mannosyltransferase